MDLTKSEMTKLQSKYKLTSRRAVAPVIATLLLVAIAVVGGSIVFVFSQGFFSSAQISGAPQIESLKISGYDASDGDILQLHDGFASGIAQGNSTSDGLIAGDRVTVYIQNNSVQKVTLGEIRFAGTVYSFVTDGGSGLIDVWNGAGTLATAGSGGPSYMLITNSNGPQGAETPATVLSASTGEIQPGQQISIILELDDNVKVGRDAQFKLSTTNGAVFVATVIAGQQTG